MAWTHAHTRTTALITMVFALFFFAAAKQAQAGTVVAGWGLQAGGWSAARLDSIASAVAGHPTSVFCSDDSSMWLAAVAAAGAATGADGYTVIGTPVVYIAPPECETLHALINQEDVGTYYAASAILALVHESVHQRGVKDEGVTDCTAVRLVPAVAVKYFGISPTVQRVIRSRKLMRVDMHRGGSPTSIKRSVANPYLARLVVDTERWHKSKPADYQGDC